MALLYVNYVLANSTRDFEDEFRNAAAEGLLAVAGITGVWAAVPSMHEVRAPLLQSSMIGLLEVLQGRAAGGKGHKMEVTVLPHLFVVHANRPRVAMSVRAWLRSADRILDPAYYAAAVAHARALGDDPNLMSGLDGEIHGPPIEGTITWSREHGLSALDRDALFNALAHALTLTDQLDAWRPWGSSNPNSLYYIMAHAIAGQGSVMNAATFWPDEADDSNPPEWMPRPKQLLSGLAVAPPDKTFNGHRTHTPKEAIAKAAETPCIYWLPKDWMFETLKLLAEARG